TVVKKTFQSGYIHSVRSHYKQIISPRLRNLIYTAHTHIEERLRHKCFYFRYKEGNIFCLRLRKALCAAVGMIIVFLYKLQHLSPRLGSDTSFSGNRPRYCTDRNPKLLCHIVDSHFPFLFSIVPHRSAPLFFSELFLSSMRPDGQTVNNLLIAKK